jgi:hypothetical protein
MPDTHKSVVRAASKQTVTATFVPDTLNLEKRTVDVVFATDAPILMGYYERYYEILSFSGEHCDFSRLNSGAPLLDTHNAYGGAANLPGVVERGWSEKGKGYATLRFSNDAGKNGAVDGPGEKLMQRVAEGIVRNVSVGYNVYEYEEVDSAGGTSIGAAKDNKIPTYMAVRWQPYEVSFVPVPADPGAGVRGINGEIPPAIDVLLTSNNKQTAMFKRHLEAGTGPEGGEGSGSAAPVGGGERGGAAAPAAAAPAPKPAAPAAAAPAVADNTDTRAMQIMEACETAKLPISFARGLIANGKDISECRSLIITELVKAGDATPTHSGNRAAVTGDEADIRRVGMEEAVLHRALPGTFKLTDAAKQYRSLSLFDMGRECLEAKNPGSTRGMSRVDIAHAALNLTHNTRGMESTSDFPIILGNLMNRTLRKQYESYKSEWRGFCRQNNSKDFRPKNIVQLSEGGKMDKIKEGGEYKNDYLKESAESYSVDKYGKKIGFTWESMINDDLGFLNRVPQIIVDMATRQQDDIIYDNILIGNPLMSDGNALFSSQHLNITTPSTINIDNLGLARLLMRQQKGIRGNQFLNITPAYLLVGPELEQLALQYMSNAYNPTEPININVWKGIMQIIVEPRITDTSWYLLAAPGSIDTIEYAFLEGEGELFTTMREGWDVDGIEMKARMVFGAKAIDWRGMVKNAGV